MSHRVENALWLFICPRERAIQISQEVERTTKNAESRGKEIMADVTNTTTEPTTNNEPQNEEQTPSVEELMAQLASERAEKEKYKNASDKASSEAAKYKKELRSKQTAEEQEAEAKAEAEKLQAEKFENMSKELNHMKAVNAYQKVIGDGKDIDSLIEAVADADHSLIATVIANEVQRQVKEAKAEWLKSRPAINAGSGEESTITQEQFNKMNYHERVELKNKNPELYKKFTE